MKISSVTSQTANSGPKNDNHTTRRPDTVRVMANHRGISHLLTPRTMYADMPAPPALTDPPPILRLPLELLLEINDYLETDAQALFSLTCKTVLHRIGCKSWEHPVLAGRWHGDAYHSRWDAPRSIPAWMLTPDTLIRVPFLQALARDSPTMTYCDTCRVLHPNLKGPALVWLKHDKKTNCLTEKGVVDWTTRDDRQVYTLLWDHIKKSMSVHAEWLKNPSSTPNHSLLYAFHTFKHKTRRNTLTHTIAYSAQPVKRNLILKQAHTFTAAQLSVTDILKTDFRICPHLTTVQLSLGRLGVAYYVGSVPIMRQARKNGPLLSYAINDAFPEGQQMSSKDLLARFRGPYAREESQMTSDRQPGDFWWCRGCATKFQVQYDEAKRGLRVDVYHNFGASSIVAKVNFEHLVRRAENNELSSLSRTFADFDCEPVVQDEQDHEGSKKLLLAARQLVA